MRPLALPLLLGIVIVAGIVARQLGGGDVAPVVAFCVALPLLFMYASGARGPVNPILVVFMLIFVVAASAAAVMALWIAGPLATVGLIVGLGVLAGVGWRRERVWKMRSESDHCPTCGYDVRATPHRCPECGLPSPSDVARRHRLREEIAAARAARENRADLAPPPPQAASVADNPAKPPPGNL